MRLMKEQVAWVWISEVRLMTGLVKDRLLGYVGLVLQWGLETEQGGWGIMELSYCMLPFSIIRNDQFYICGINFYNFEDSLNIILCFKEVKNVYKRLYSENKNKK